MRICMYAHRQSPGGSAALDAAIKKALLNSIDLEVDRTKAAGGIAHATALLKKGMAGLGKATSANDVLAAKETVSMHAWVWVSTVRAACRLQQWCAS